MLHYTLKAAKKCKKRIMRITYLVLNFLGKPPKKWQKISLQL